MAALSHRNYRLFFFGQAISLIGTWMQSVGQQWLVIDKLTPSPFLLSLVAAAQFTPVLILSLAAGAAAGANEYSVKGTMDQSRILETVARLI